LSGYLLKWSPPSGTSTHDTLLSKHMYVYFFGLGNGVSIQDGYG
jgi:hypothetical protein